MLRFPAVWLILPIRLFLQVINWKVWVWFIESEPSVWEFYGVGWGRFPLYLFSLKLVACSKRTNKMHRG